MIYKVGDRVRVVGFPRSASKLKNMGAHGREATVSEVLVGMLNDYRVVIDGWPSAMFDGSWSCKANELAPLTPPAEDAWAADKVRELVKPKPMDVERAVEKIREVFPGF